jgi:hypothetical protein
MKFEDLVKSVSEMHNNENIIIENLTLIYTLPEKNHRQMHEEIFYKNHSADQNPILADEFEVDMGSITVRFIKQQENTES